MTLCELLHLARKGYAIEITDKWITVHDKRKDSKWVELGHIIESLIYVPVMIGLALLLFA